MTRIESDTHSIQQSAESIYSFLSDFNNFKDIMPEQVVDFSSDKDQCKFTIKGMATLGMKIIERKENEFIRINSTDVTPFPFELSCSIKENDSNKSDVQLAIDAQLNPFMKMMAEKPLKNFLNLLLSRYKDRTSS
ncbi:MAG TPA: SRPBCC family protein [Bacteroidia bacterium]|nr:SRPBCC family protein [Bacteroidia bacterium]HNT79487.1 SRPBCC family protein [Bacteroidia bacterium]